jgi:hypothetical protein
MNPTWSNNPPPKLERITKQIVTQVQQELTIELPAIIAQIDCSHAKTSRNFAAIVTGDPSYLYMCEDLADQPTHRIKGILYHEMGHILQCMLQIDKHKNLDSEQTADFLIEATCGVKILYDRDLIQTIDSKIGVSKRPKGLK